MGRLEQRAAHAFGSTS